MCAVRSSRDVLRESQVRCAFQNALWVFIERAVDERVHAERDTAPTKRHEFDLASLPGFESKRRSRGNVEPASIRQPAIESQFPVHLEEVCVGADLNRTIPVIVDAKSHASRPGIQFDRLVAEEVFARNHLRRQRIGSWTVTSLVPSGKVPSTCTSWIISAMPSITSSRVRTCAPSVISSATVLPSRMPSRTSAVMRATASG